MQVIVYAKDDGSVVVCYPSGELPIEEVMQKDCPPGAFITESDLLPQGINDYFFNAWVLDGQNVIVNIDKAKAYQTQALNTIARGEAKHRQENDGAGIPNNITQEQWLQMLTTARLNIQVATTTQQLMDAIAPVLAEIELNK